MDALNAIKMVIAEEEALAVEALTAYGMAMHDAWFASKIRDEQMLGLLRYASPDMLIGSMHALLYAYAHPGTREGFCQLCLGLFGRDAIVIIDDEPAIVSVDVYIRNEAFYFAIAESGFAAAMGFALAEISLASLTSDPRSFLEQFLPAGVMLRELNFALGGSEDNLENLSSRGEIKI